jgi:hypothetical protein
MIYAVILQNPTETLALCMHDALNVECCKINSSVHQTLDITYTARVPASCTTGTESRRYDDGGTVGLSTYSVGYDWQINPIQSWTDRTSCKENILDSLD